MIKWILPIAILLFVCVSVALSTKFHYPDLPFANKTKQEVANLATSSVLPLSKITQENGYVWLITDDSEDVALESLKQRMIKNGWEFIEQTDSGCYFEKGNEKVMIVSKRWTRNYFLFQLPLGF